MATPPTPPVPKVVKQAQGLPVVGGVLKFGADFGKAVDNFAASLGIQTANSQRRAVMDTITAMGPALQRRDKAKAAFLEALRGASPPIAKELTVKSGFASHIIGPAAANLLTTGPILAAYNATVDTTTKDPEGRVGTSKLLPVEEHAWVGMNVYTYPLDLAWLLRGLALEAAVYDYGRQEIAANAEFAEPAAIFSTPADSTAPLSLGKGSPGLVAVVLAIAAGVFFIFSHEE